MCPSESPWTIVCQAPLSMGLSRQEYWSGLPFPSTGDFPDPRINLGLLHYRQTLYQLSYKGSPALCLLCELFSNDFFKDFTHLNESTSIMPDSCDRVDRSPPGSSVRGMFQARILEWVAISFSRKSSQSRDQIRVSCIAGRFFTNCTNYQELI